jgi:hypothetical protein
MVDMAATQFQTQLESFVVHSLGSTPWLLQMWGVQTSSLEVDRYLCMVRSGLVAYDLTTIASPHTSLSLSRPDPLASPLWPLPGRGIRLHVLPLTE